MYDNLKMPGTAYSPMLYSALTSGVPLETARTMVLLPTFGAPTSTTVGVLSSITGMRRRVFCSSPICLSAVALSCVHKDIGQRY
jgi:hypothetical protein